MTVPTCDHVAAGHRRRLIGRSFTPPALVCCESHNAVNNAGIST
jgi:hypothetical protein